MEFINLVRGSSPGMASDVNWTTSSGPRVTAPRTLNSRID